MSGEELKACPMCGSGAARSEGRFTNASFSGVEVMDEIYHPFVWCGTCCLRTRSCDSVAEAVEAWNQRAHPLPEQPQEGEDREVMFEVWQDDMMVASSTDEADAIHYLAVYAQDGPAKLMRAETVRTTLATETKEGGDA